MYLGRLDNQVKVRGHRIEPDEIAATLKLHPMIRDAVVVPQRPPQQGPDESVPCAVCAFGENDVEQTFETWPSIAEHFVYDELLYHAMTHDELRNQKYRYAIDRLVPGKTVVDIGTGAMRFCAFLHRGRREAGVCHRDT